jgi:hypothetical protein
MMPHMTKKLKEAAEAYAAALAEETSAKQAVVAARHRRTEAGKAVAEARVPLASEIVASARAGMRQRDILDAIGNVYTRETIRRICRAAGVEPAE